MDLIDKVAEAIHDGWWEGMILQNYKLGPRQLMARDTGLKLHPHMIPFDALSEESRRIDRHQALAAIKQWAAGTLGDDSLVAMARCLHDAWVEYARITRPDHPHIQCAWEDHEPWAEQLHMLSAQHAIRVLCESGL